MTVKTDNYQVGQSPTTSQNFVIKTGNDGTLTIARGVVGSELGDVLKVNSDGTISGPFLGIGQTYQDMTASRISGTTYTNTSGKPIWVTVMVLDSTSASTITVSGLIIQSFDINSSGSFGNISAIVPNGATYSVTAPGGIQYWRELR